MKQSLHALLMLALSTTAWAKAPAVTATPATYPTYAEFMKMSSEQQKDIVYITRDFVTALAKNRITHGSAKLDPQLLNLFVLNADAQSDGTELAERQRAASELTSSERAREGAVGRVATGADDEAKAKQLAELNQAYNSQRQEVDKLESDIAQLKANKERHEALLKANPENRSYRQSVWADNDKLTAENKKLDDLKHKQELNRTFFANAVKSPLVPGPEPVSNETLMAANNDTRNAARGKDDKFLCFYAGFAIYKPKPCRPRSRAEVNFKGKKVVLSCKGPKSDGVITPEHLDPHATTLCGPIFTLKKGNSIEPICIAGGTDASKQCREIAAQHADAEGSIEVSRELFKSNGTVVDEYKVAFDHYCAGTQISQIREKLHTDKDLAEKANIDDIAKTCGELSERIAKLNASSSHPDAPTTPAAR